MAVIKTRRRSGERSAESLTCFPSPVGQDSSEGIYCMCEICHILVNLLTGFHRSTLNEGIEFVILFSPPILWKSHSVTFEFHQLFLHFEPGFILVLSFLFMLKSFHHIYLFSKCFSLLQCCITKRLKRLSEEQEHWKLMNVSSAREINEDSRLFILHAFPKVPRHRGGINGGQWTEFGSRCDFH